jgi:hypothetical protein
MEFPQDNAVIPSQDNAVISKLLVLTRIENQKQEHKIPFPRYQPSTPQFKRDMVRKFLK